MCNGMVNLSIYRKEADKYLQKTFWNSSNLPIGLICTGCAIMHFAAFSNMGETYGPEETRYF